MKTIEFAFQPTPIGKGVNVVVCRDEKTNNFKDVLMERRFFSDESKPIFFSSSDAAHEKAAELSQKHGIKFTASCASFPDGLFGHVIFIPSFDKFLS